MDTDSLAIRSTISNLSLNQFDKNQIDLCLGSIDCLLPLLKGESADLLICNILAPVLEDMAPKFEDLVVSNGRALLSGLLVNQAPALQKTLLSLGWEVSDFIEMDNWGLLDIKRP